VDDEHQGTMTILNMYVYNGQTFSFTSNGLSFSPLLGVHIFHYMMFCITQYAWKNIAGVRMKKEARATRFADTVEHKPDQQLSVSVNVDIHQQGTMNHEDVSIN